MENNERSVPKRGPGGPGMRGSTGEKAKNFKSAINRLISELKAYHIPIMIALVLAVLGSVLSILAPNKLSDLADEISSGLVLKTDNLETLTKNITENLNTEYLMEVTPEILAIDMSNDTISNIMASNEILENDKTQFQETLALIATMDGTSSSMISLLAQLPESILNELLPETTYQNTVIPTAEKIQFLKTVANIAETNLENLTIPPTIGSILFPEIEVLNVTLSSSEQATFLNLMSSIDLENLDVNQLYQQIDQMPENIQKIVVPEMNMNKIKNIALFLVILYVISAVFTYIVAISMTIVSNRFANHLRRKISHKMNQLPLQYFDQHAIGDTLSRVTNDVDTIAQSMNQSLATLVSAITLFVGTIIMMFYTNWIMAITAILASLFGFIFMISVLSKSQKYFVQRQEELGNLNGHIEEVYSGLNVVKAYNGKKASDQKFDEYNLKVYNANRKSQFLSGLMQPMMSFIGNFGYVAVCIVGALLTMNDMISFGVIVAFITYVRLFTSPLSQIAQAMTSMQSTAAASERVFEFLDEEEMESQDKITKVLKKEKVKGKIEFQNVVFQYAGNDTPTIKNFTAKALPGQKIAIVGPTGAGKTTMVNLLMKFYDISSGEIKIDGISTKNLTRENIHNLFTMVLQDTWLFHGTLKENIAYNRKDVSEEKIKEVCKKIGLDHFVKTLPNGYDTIISDNDSVSAGQRQLLTIARGMIEDAPFLILDEATSNVDTRTEELVQQAMDKLTEGRTSFIIAHRLSTIKNADLILVMKDGNIIETGNHDELMNKKGFYAELYNSQFEL